MAAAVEVVHGLDGQQHRELLPRLFLRYRQAQLQLAAARDHVFEYLVDDIESRIHVVVIDDERRSQAKRTLPGTEQQEATAECALMELELGRRDREARVALSELVGPAPA